MEYSQDQMEFGFDYFVSILYCIELILFKSLLPVADILLALVLSYASRDSIDNLSQELILQSGFAVAILVLSL